MRKIIILSIIIICSSFIVKAQDVGLTRYSAGIELGSTSGTNSNAWGLGIGVSGQVEHFFQENLSGTFLVGVVSYIGKSYPGNSGLKYKAYNAVPIRIGVRYYIVDGFHVGAQLGVGLNTGGNTFAYSPQVGYNFKTNSGSSIDASFKYDGYSGNGTFSALGIRVAYIF